MGREMYRERGSNLVKGRLYRIRDEQNLGRRIVRTRIYIESAEFPANTRLTPVVSFLR